MTHLQMEAVQYDGNTFVKYIFQAVWHDRQHCMCYEFYRCILDKACIKLNYLVKIWGGGGQMIGGIEIKQIK